MKAIITRQQLLMGLSAVSNVIGTRTTLPILSNVLLDVRDDRLHVTATDLDVTVITSVEAQIYTAGKLTVPAKRLSAIAKELGAEEVELEVDDKFKMSIVAGSSKFNMYGLKADEFPPHQTVNDPNPVKVPQAILSELLNLTEYAISTDESRHTLQGVFFVIGKGELKCVATDGRRLALASTELDEITSKETREFIVPTKAINELSRLLGDKGTVEIAASESGAMFTLTDEAGNATYIITKLIEGNYPNYKQVIPGDSKERVEFTRDEIQSAVRRAALMTSDKASSIKFSFTKNNLLVSANSPEVGEGQDSMAVNYKGKDLAIAFNPVYVLEPLNRIQTERVAFHTIDELSPVIVRQVADAKHKTDFLYVMMPMRLS